MSDMTPDQARAQLEAWRAIAYSDSQRETIHMSRSTLRLLIDAADVLADPPPNAVTPPD